MEEEKMLDYIYQNVNMGIVSLNNLIPNIDDKRFLKVLNNQNKEYLKIKNKVKILSKENNFELKDVNFFAKVMAGYSTRINVYKNNDSCYIAKLMIKGTNTGIIAIREKLNNLAVKNKEIKKLGILLQLTLENNLNELKKYL
ncbi:MAG: hypothetical protein R3Y21_05555 [Mycoplasmatota bacterium]